MRSHHIQKDAAGCEFQRMPEMLRTRCAGPERYPLGHVYSLLPLVTCEDRVASTPPDQTRGPNLLPETKLSDFQLPLLEFVSPIPEFNRSAFQTTASHAARLARPHDVTVPPS
jgi:hypothetical protein